MENKEYFEKRLEVVEFNSQLIKKAINTLFNSAMVLFIVSAVYCGAFLYLFFK